MVNALFLGLPTNKGSLPELEHRSVTDIRRVVDAIFLLVLAIETNYLLCETTLLILSVFILKDAFTETIAISMT